MINDSYQNDLIIKETALVIFKFSGFQVFNKWLFISYIIIFVLVYYILVIR